MIVVRLADERVYVDSVVWKIAIRVRRVVDNQGIGQILIDRLKIKKKRVKLDIKKIIWSEMPTKIVIFRSF